MKALPALLLVLMLASIIGAASATTLIVPAIGDNSDGKLRRAGTNATFYALRNGVGTEIQNTTGYITGAGFIADKSTNTYKSFTRFGWCGNATAAGLPAGATINSGTFKVYAESSSSAMGLGNISFGLTDFTPTNALMLSMNDYNKTTYYRYADNDKKWYVNWSGDGYNSYTLNAGGLANVSTTGTTCMMLMARGDIDNSTIEITAWNSEGYSIVKTYDTAMSGTDKDPILELDYTAAGGAPGVSFTSNVSSGAPILGVAFTDTSSIASPTARVWEYKDFGTLPEQICTGVPSTCTSTKTWHEFSNTNSATPTYSWGAGNWSIRLTETNATGTFVSTDYYHWINVSAGVTGSTRLSGSYTFHPADTIWYQNISNSTRFPVKSQNAAWITRIKAIATEGAFSDNVEVFLRGSRGAYFIINDTNSNIVHQKFLDDNTSSSYYDYGSVGGNGGFPIPDDVVVSKTSWTDYPVDLIDTQNNIVYSISNTMKQYNGVFTGSPTIVNSSSYCYRFSAYANGTDNGCRWLGNKWYTIAGGVFTPRTERLMWYPSDAGIAVPDMMVRHEEVATGFVNHSLMGTIHLADNSVAWPAVGDGEGSKSGYCPPSGHATTGGCCDHTCPPPGSYLRLKASYDISGLNTEEKVIATALKNYGIIIINTGTLAGLQINGYNDSAWGAADLDGLRNIDISEFEFIDVSSLMRSSYSLQTNVGLPSNPPSFTKSRIVVRIPANITFTDTTSGTVSAWNWSFGNGVYSTSQNPTYQYKKPGRYTVSLTTAGGVAYSTVTVIRGGGGEQMFTPSLFRDRALMVNCEDFTYTVSREITEMERIRTDEKIAGVCYDLP